MVNAIAMLGGVRASLFALLSVTLAGLLFWQWGARQLAEERLADAKAEVVEAREIAMETYRALTEQNSAIDAEYQEKLDEAQAKHDRVVADLRSARLQLQDHWTCPAPDSAAPGVVDEGARLREEAAARIVQIGAEADAQIAGLQSVIKELQEKYGGEVGTGSE